MLDAILSSSWVRNLPSRHSFICLSIHETSSQLLENLKGFCKTRAGKSMAAFSATPSKADALP